MIKNPSRVFYTAYIALLAGFCLLSLLEPSFAADNPFEKIKTKLGEAEGYILSFIYIFGGVCFVGLLLASFMGKVHWRYAAVVLGIIVIAGIYQQIITWVKG